jgi:putative nucleotidyltransferase with HDIG domain
MRDVAVVTTTFLFTDIEGSTALWEREPEAMRQALQRHNALVAETVANHDGCVFKTMGDAFCVTFDHAPDAVSAAVVIQERIAAEPWTTTIPLRVRVGLHSGQAHLNEGDYYGTTVNRCARLLGVARGGQTLVSSATAKQARATLPPGANLRDLGMHRLRDLARPLQIFQLLHASLPPDLEISDLSSNGRADGRATPRFDPANLYDVPTLSAVVAQALDVLQRPETAAREVEHIVLKDPAISAKLLRVANSPFFGLARRITTVVDAVRVLGFANVQGMILGLAAFDAFRSARLGLVDFWKHSITVGTGARFLAGRVGWTPEEAFTAGILHDIGKLILVVQNEAEYRQVLVRQRESGRGSLEAEQALFEFTHAEAGALVAERWQLPTAYVDTIAHHHDPTGAEEAGVLCALVAVADHAAHGAFEGAFSHQPLAAERSLALECVGLGEDDWEACLAHLREAEDGIDLFVSGMR